MSRTGQFQTRQRKVNDACFHAVEWQAVCVALDLESERLGLGWLEKDVAPVQVAVLKVHGLLGCRQAQSRLQEDALCKRKA